MTTAALLLAVLIAGPEPRPADPPVDPAAHAVLAEMAPAPGRWEVEDAPAYFSDRPAIMDAPAPGEPVARGDPAFAAGVREGDARGRGSRVGKEGARWISSMIRAITCCVRPPSSQSTGSLQAATINSRMPMERRQVEARPPLLDHRSFRSASTDRRASILNRPE